MPNYRQLQRIDSAERWERFNPVLEDGELGIARFPAESGGAAPVKAKSGDGKTPWNDLPWLAGGPGEKGDKGDKPGHKWSGTSLSIENPDGSWGTPVDLKGEEGDPGTAKPATETTLGGVIPATGTRTDIEGRLYVTLKWVKSGCYPDPILVSHNGAAYLWLQKSGVGTDAGAREPGTEAAAKYWRPLAAVADLPVLPTITTSTATPQGGEDGDIWLQYL